MKQPKVKLIIEEQIAKKIAGIAAIEMRTFNQQLAYWASNYEAKNGTVTPKVVDLPQKKDRKPMLISPERRAQMREQGLRLAVAAKAKADARRVGANGLAH
jgi:uncharacterized protein HemX